MIDWISARIPLRHRPIDAGRVLKISPDGELEWESHSWTDCPGSHDANFRLRSYGADFIDVSANALKWLQGHNLFGSGDVYQLLFSALRDVLPRCGIAVDDAELEVAVHLAKLTRVDVTEMFSLRDRAAVRTFLRALSERAALRNRGRGSLVNEGTLYFGQHSRRWSLKIYAKGDEVDAHPLSESLLFRDRLLDYADNKIRVELVLRSMQLSSERLSSPTQWSDNRSSDVFKTFLEKLEVSGKMKLTTEQLTSLAPRLQMAYQAWVDGHDLRQLLSRATFFRYRRELMAHGVDISLRRPSKPASNVIELQRVLVAVPAQVPDWAVGTPLLFVPSKRAA